MSEQLEQLYQEARSALKTKDYDRANGLFKQILVIDENYKDVSRLLAQSVELKRRRWYKDPRLWVTVGVAIVIALVFLLAPRVSRLFAKPVPITPTIATQPTSTIPSTDAHIPTETLAPTPTSFPLAWKRISIGQEFPRDSVKAIIVDTNDPDVIYVGMSNAGIYKSIDGGISWQPAFSGIRNPNVSFLLIDAQNPQTLYASFRSDRNFISTDGGENWQRANPETASYFFLDPQDSTHIFAWSDFIFSESVDGGKTWTTNYESKEGDCPQSFGGTETAGFLNETSTLYLLADGEDACPIGIYQSKDAGHTWTLLYGGTTEENLDEFDIGRDSQGNAIFYVITSNGLLVSYDEGRTWIYAAPEYCSALVVDAKSPATAYCGASDTRLLITEDGGRTWSNFGVEANFGNVRSIHIDYPSGTSRILVGGGNGLFASTDDGNSWIELANGLGATNLQVRIHPSDNSIMFADAQTENWAGCSLLRSQDHGKTWNSVVTTQYPARCEPEFDVNGNIYLIQEGSMVMSSDKGDTWQPLPKPYGVNHMMWVNVSQYQSAPLFGGDIENGVRPLRVFYSNDIGNIWALGSEVATEAWDWDLRLLFDHQGKYIYAQGIHDVFRSEDGGMTWLPCAGMDNIGYGRSDTSLAIDPKDGARFFLATSSVNRGGLFFTLDACQTWQKTGLESLFVNSVAIDPIDNNIIYSGTDSGAYVSIDNGQTWNQINYGLLGAMVVYSIAIDKDSNVYAATPYGIFKLEGK